MLQVKVLLPSCYTMFYVTGLLLCLLQQQAVSNSSIKLSTLLLSRKPVLIHDFISLARQSKNLRQNAAIVLPLLSAAFKSGAPIEQNILNKIYNEYSAEIQAAVLEPSKATQWLKCYSSVVVQLMHKCMGKLYVTETLSIQKQLFLCKLLQLQIIHGFIQEKQPSCVSVSHSTWQNKVTRSYISCELCNKCCI
jgi:hypothetical protein